MADAAVASTMVERAARALCEHRQLPSESWPACISDVHSILGGMILPPIPVARDGAPETHPDLHAWAAHRAHFGTAGAKAREPRLDTVTGEHVLLAWRTWNGMIQEALEAVV